MQAQFNSEIFWVRDTLDSLTLMLNTYPFSENNPTTDFCEHSDEPTVVAEAWNESSGYVTSYPSKILSFNEEICVSAS
jgi:hypothetical protein